MTEINKIAGALRELLKEKEIIARCELLLRTYGIVLAANLSDQEFSELRKMVGEHIAPGIFASIMNGESVFFDLPKLDTYTQINGRIFHFLHTKRYSRQDFDEASRKFHQTLPELKSILCRSLVSLLKDFMAKAGYSICQEGSQDLIFYAGERHLRILVASSVKSLDIEKLKSPVEMESAFLVPSSETLEPFVQFFQENGQIAEDAGIQVWVANLEQGTIDPFIGYTTDMDIYEQFKNPRLAEMVRTNWSLKR